MCDQRVFQFEEKKSSNTHIEYEELDHETDDGLLACSKASSFNDDFSLLSIILISFITTFLSHLIFRQISPQVGCFDTLPSSIEDTLYLTRFSLLYQVAINQKILIIFQHNNICQHKLLEWLSMNIIE